VDGEIRAKRDYFPHFNYGKAKRSAEFLANNLQPMFSFVSFLCAKEKKGSLFLCAKEKKGILFLCAKEKKGILFLCAKEKKGKSQRKERGSRDFL